jgi:hypothetical protein
MLHDLLESQHIKARIRIEYNNRSAFAIEEYIVYLWGQNRDRSDVV